MKKFKPLPDLLHYPESLPYPIKWLNSNVIAHRAKAGATKTTKLMKTLNSIATDFYHAFYNKVWLGDKASVTGLSIAEAYEVQDLVAGKRIQSGEPVAGFKVGCTSDAIQTQFGINEPINAKLFHPHILDHKVKIDWSEYIYCAIEPEMVITIGKDLEGKNLSDEELIDAIAHVSPGIEMHEYHFWIKPPTIQELICSGGIHKGLIVGDQKVSPADLRFEDEIFAVYKNSELITSAPASEIMGGPLHSLRWLVTFLTKKGAYLEKGSLVIPGSPVELVSIDQDTELTVEIDHLGVVTTFFERK